MEKKLLRMPKRSMTEVVEPEEEEEGGGGGGEEEEEEEVSVFCQLQNL